MCEARPASMRGLWLLAVVRAALSVEASVAQVVGTVEEPVRVVLTARRAGEPGHKLVVVHAEAAVSARVLERLARAETAQTSFAAAVAEAGTVVARRAMVLALERVAVVDTLFRAHPAV